MLGGIEISNEKYAYQLEFAFGLEVYKEALAFLK